MRELPDILKENQTKKLYIHEKYDIAEVTQRQVYRLTELYGLQTEEKGEDYVH